MRKQNQGFAHIAVLLIVLVLAISGVAAWRVYSVNKNKKPIATKVEHLGSEQAEEVTGGLELLWQQDDGGWKAIGDVPDCPKQPMMKMPADILMVTAVLYPGQTRGGNYKPHGGFRFDNSNNGDIKVNSPMEGFIVRGGRYLSGGEVQYTFDVFNNCGVMYRVGHLRSLPESLQELADTWPEASEGDSRTQSVNPPVHVKQGDRLGESVGIITDGNVFFDWGVYDYRQENEASKDPEFKAAHEQDKELSWHAVCWFDWLSSVDAKKLKTLPAGDLTSGKSSDYCK